MKSGYRKWEGRYRHRSIPHWRRVVSVIQSGSVARYRIEGDGLPNRSRVVIVMPHRAGMYMNDDWEPIREAL